MGAIIPIIGAVASLAGSVLPLFMGGGGGSAPVLPPPLPPPPVPTDDSAEVKDREKAERLRRQKARGLSSTILTQGLAEEELELAKPTLLGDTN